MESMKRVPAVGDTWSVNGYKWVLLTRVESSFYGPGFDARGECGEIGMLNDGDEFAKGAVFVSGVSPAPEGGTGVPVVRRCQSDTCATLRRAEHDTHSLGVLPKSFVHGEHCYGCFRATVLVDGYCAACQRALVATPSPAPVAPGVALPAQPRPLPGTPFSPASPMPPIPTVAHTGHRTFQGGCAECSQQREEQVIKNRLAEKLPGIVGKTLPPARYVFVPKVDEWDLLEDAGARSWRSR